MERRKLEDKIKRVGYFASAGVLCYLLISLLILSSYPLHHYLLDKKLAYDVLKDGLTLGAAFLAPIAAFVLFNDWKEDHRVKKRELYFIETYKLLESLFMDLKLLYYKSIVENIYTQEKVDFLESEFEKFQVNLKEAVLFINNIHVDSPILFEFVNKVTHIIQYEFASLIAEIGMSYGINKIISFPNNYKELFIDNETVEDFVIRYVEFRIQMNDNDLENQISNIREKIEEIKDFSKDLMI